MLVYHTMSIVVLILVYLYKVGSKYETITNILDMIFIVILTSFSS